ncbi:TauD/TfdA dioxygenase family protein [Rhizorhabdus histidinilytica]
MAEINHGSMLRALEVPPEGGRTGFMDRIRLYELLPDDLKRRIEGLDVVYRFQPDMMKRRYCRPADMALVAPSMKAGMFDGDVLDRDFPPVAHPMVYTDRDSGRKVLNVAPLFAVGIVGMDDPKGDALLGAVIDHCCTADFAYFHRWAVGDMIIWDNWRALHSAEGVPRTIRAACSGPAWPAIMVSAGCLGRSELMSRHPSRSWDLPSSLSRWSQEGNDTDRAAGLEPTSRLL